MSTLVLFSFKHSVIYNSYFNFKAIEYYWYVGNVCIISIDNYIINEIFRNLTHDNNHLHLCAISLSASINIVIINGCDWKCVNASYSWWVFRIKAKTTSVNGDSGVYIYSYTYRLVILVYTFCDPHTAVRIFESCTMTACMQHGPCWLAEGNVSRCSSGDWYSMTTLTFSWRHFGYSISVTYGIVVPL